MLAPLGRARAKLGIFTGCFFVQHDATQLCHNAQGNQGNCYNNKGYFSVLLCQFRNKLWFNYFPGPSEEEYGLIKVKQDIFSDIFIESFNFDKLLNELEYEIHHKKGLDGQINGIKVVPGIDSHVEGQYIYCTYNYN